MLFAQRVLLLLTLPDCPVSKGYKAFETSVPPTFSLKSEVPPEQLALVKMFIDPSAEYIPSSEVVVLGAVTPMVAGMTMFPFAASTKRLFWAVGTEIGAVIVAFPLTRRTICFPPVTLPETETSPEVWYIPEDKAVKPILGAVTGFMAIPRVFAWER